MQLHLYQVSFRLLRYHLRQCDHKLTSGTNLWCLCSKVNKMHQCIKFVSDGLSVHHEEFKTVHTATSICQLDTAVCLTNGCCCMYSLELLMMDGKTVRNM